MKNFFLPVAAIFIFIFFNSCATMSDVLSSKDDGTAEIYPVGFDKAWDIATTVLRWEGAESIEHHKDKGYMVTQTSQNLVLAGALIGVWVDKIDNSHSKVTVVTKRKMATNIATGLTESTFHSKFAQAIKIVKSGKSLPIEAPASE